SSDRLTVRDHPIVDARLILIRQVSPLDSYINHIDAVVIIQLPMHILRDPHVQVASGRSLTDDLPVLNLRQITTHGAVYRVLNQLLRIVDRTSRTNELP